MDTSDLLHLLALPPIPKVLLPSTEQVRAHKATREYSPGILVNVEAALPAVSWVEETLGFEVRRCYLQLMLKDYPVHVDTTRNVGLNFLVDQGAIDPPCTTYYENNSPVYSNRVAEGNWFLLRTDIPHAVLGQTRPRYLFIVSLLQDDWPEVKTLFSKYIPPYTKVSNDRTQESQATSDGRLIA